MTMKQVYAQIKVMMAPKDSESEYWKGYNAALIELQKALAHEESSAPQPEEYWLITILDDGGYTTIYGHGDFASWYSREKAPLVNGPIPLTRKQYERCQK